MFSFCCHCCALSVSCSEWMRNIHVAAISTIVSVVILLQLSAARLPYRDSMLKEIKSITAKSVVCGLRSRCLFRLFVFGHSFLRSFAERNWIIYFILMVSRSALAVRPFGKKNNFTRSSCFCSSIYLRRCAIAFVAFIIILLNISMMLMMVAGDNNDSQYSLLERISFSPFDLPSQAPNLSRVHSIPFWLPQRSTVSIIIFYFSSFVSLKHHPSHWLNVCEGKRVRIVANHSREYINRPLSSPREIFSVWQT